MEDDEALPPASAEEFTDDKIREAVRHVIIAKAQRKLYRARVKQAREYKQYNAPFSSAQITLIIDYCQDIEVPFLGKEQPGCTYYWKKYNAFCFGVVDCAHVFTDEGHAEDVGDHMTAYCYEEWGGEKGADNVTSMVMKFLGDNNMLKPNNETGGRLTLFGDNCGGQNKNNTLLIRLAAYLVESGHFKEVEIVFLVVGHTKNACDWLFNNLKEGYTC